MRTRSSLITSVMATLTAVALALTIAPSASAADSVDTSVNVSVETWQEAADALGTAGSLWEPAFTAGLAQRGDIDVLAEGITVQNGQITAGSTFAGAAYGARRTPRITIAERWADTGWAGDPATDIRRAPVGRVTIRLGDPGTQIRIPATVYANCYTKATTGEAPPPPRSLRCSRADVLKYGGTLRMTAKPPSAMTGPGTTAIQIDVTGLTYSQLLRVASSLQQVAPSMNSAGSAQMRGMCAQMVDGKMTLDQASAFATANGFTVRPGSINGQVLAVTTDYRPERFTLTLVNDAVTSCTYG